MEESTEVLEEVRAAKGRGEPCGPAVIKEVGDTLWYCVGLCRASELRLVDIVGEAWEKVPEDSDTKESELALVQRIGHLAGRLKKYERGDYGAEKLREYMVALLPGQHATH